MFRHPLRRTTGRGAGWASLFSRTAKLRSAWPPANKARNLAALGITANAINPGPVDTGWMTDENRADTLARTPLRRGGRPEDTANLVAFLCSDQGGWVNGQLLYSNGGFRGTIG